MMQVSVEENLCQGHARCWSLCPEVFDLDDEGHAIVHDSEVPVGLEEKVKMAAQSCPEKAIFVT